MIELSKKHLRGFSGAQLQFSCKAGPQECKFLHKFYMMQIIVFENFLPDILFFCNLFLTPFFRLIFRTLKIFHFLQKAFKIRTILHLFQVLIFTEFAAENQVRFDVYNGLSECCPA